MLSALRRLGDKNPNFTISDLSGIINITSSLDPFDVVKKLRAKILDEPWSVRYCHRIIPIEEKVITEKDTIVKSAIRNAKKITEYCTYRITIEKRNYTISSKEIIESIANEIQGKVSLEKFDWIILIEILGNETGISVLKEDDILSIQKLKRSLSE